MGKLSWFNKVMYSLNVVATILTFVAYALPLFAPKVYSVLSVLTLILPFFLILNGLFFVYWLIQFKRQFLLSSLVLLLGITFINKFYKFSTTQLPEEEKDFTVMSYNVRLFNLFDWIPNKDIKNDILSFVNEQNPDILCVQEYSENAHVDFRAYKYKVVFMEGRKVKTGQAIFSKYPIFNQGDFKIKEAGNNIIYADIRKGKDTIRVYNIHLQSIKISPDVDELAEHVDSINQNKSQLVFNRIKEAFKKQEHQASSLIEHKEKCKFPVIICGDMNNSPFSYIYRTIRRNMKDCFEEAGSGFGQTYKFKYYPARIDYIFADKKMRVKNFTSFTKFQKSDHFPIMTRLSIMD